MAACPKVDWWRFVDPIVQTSDFEAIIVGLDGKQF